MSLSTIWLDTEGIVIMGAENIGFIAINSKDIHVFYPEKDITYSAQTLREGVEYCKFPFE